NFDCPAAQLGPVALLLAALDGEDAEQGYRRDQQEDRQGHPARMSHQPMSCPPSVGFKLLQIDSPPRPAAPSAQLRESSNRPVSSRPAARSGNLMVDFSFLRRVY